MLKTGLAASAARSSLGMPEIHRKKGNKWSPSSPNQIQGAIEEGSPGPGLSKGVDIHQRRTCITESHKRTLTDHFLLGAELLYESVLRNSRLCFNVNFDFHFISAKIYITYIHYMRPFLWGRGLSQREPLMIKCNLLFGNGRNEKSN